MEEKNTKFNPRRVDPREVEANKVLAAISYLGLLCLVPLFLKKSSPYVQFHAKQGLVLLIAEIIISFVNIIPFFGMIVWGLAAVLFFYCFNNGFYKNLEWFFLGNPYCF